MRIYREKDFDRDTFWKIFAPGCRPGETAEDIERKTEKLLKASGIQPIAETDEEIKIGDTLEIEGNYYHVGICGKKKCTVDPVEKIELDEPEEREDEGELYCPYCGNEIPDSFEIDSEDEHECPFCGSIFEIVKEVQIRWSSYPVRAAKIKKIHPYKSGKDPILAAARVSECPA